MNWWIHSGQGFIGSFHLLWSEWSQITDPDPNHLKGTHPNISSWFPVVWTDGHKVTWLPKFLRWIDYQHLLMYGAPLAWSSAMICTVVKASLMKSQKYASRSGWTWPITICGKKYSKFFYSSTFTRDPNNLVFTRLQAPKSKVQSRGNDSIVLMTLTPIKLILIFTWS